MAAAAAHAALLQPCTLRSGRAAVAVCMQGFGRQRAACMCAARRLPARLRCVPGCGAGAVLVGDKVPSGLLEGRWDLVGKLQP